MFKPSLTPRLKVAVAGLSMTGALLGAATPALALTNTGDTVATVQANDETNLKFRVPAVIPFAADNNGVLTGPSPDATKIENLSPFAIHITKMEVGAMGTWNLADDATKSDKDNTIDFQVGPEGELQDAFTASQDGGIDTSASKGFDMNYMGSGNDTIPLFSQGDINKVSMDISTPKEAALITWTAAAGRSPEY